VYGVLSIAHDADAISCSSVLPIGYTYVRSSSDRRSVDASIWKSNEVIALYESIASVSRYFQSVVLYLVSLSVFHSVCLSVAYLFVAAALRCYCCCCCK